MNMMMISWVIMGCESCSGSGGGSGGGNHDDYEHEL